MNENCPYDDECGILSSCDETCCRVKELFDDYYKLEKLYFERVEENKKLKEWEEANKPTGICETCTAGCVLENDKLRIENRKLRQTVMTTCPQCGEVYLTSEGSKLYEENEKLKKQLQQSTKDFCKSCAEDCALGNTEMIQKLKRLLDNEKHYRYQAEAKLDKVRPILEYYTNSKAGELHSDGTYKITISKGEDYEECLTFDPRPAKEGLEIIEAEIMEKNKKLEGILYEKLLELVSPRLLSDFCGYNEETHSFDIILALKEILEYLENEKEA